MAPTQHQCLRQLSEAFARALLRGLKPCFAKAIAIHHAYPLSAGDAPKTGAPFLTLIPYWVEPVTDRRLDRILGKLEDGTEYFREPPVLLQARYALTAHGPSPDDQDVLMAAARVVHDMGVLGDDGEGPADAVHWEDKPTPVLVPRFSLEEARVVAEAHGMPLRPTLRYDVPFRLDSERKTVTKRVKERIVDYKKLDG